jgi:hypothetical protein
MKVDIDNVELLLKEKGVPEKQTQEIISQLQAIVEEEKALKEPKTKSKNQFFGIATGDTINDSPVFIVQAKEEMQHTEILPKITDAVKEYNQGKKGQKTPIKTIGEAFEHCTKKFFTSRGINPKTKEPIIIVQTTNDINFGVNQNEI